MANKFCGLLSNGLRIQTDWGKLNALPCCVYPGTPIYFSDPEYDAKFTQIHNQKHCSGCDYHHISEHSLRGQARNFVDPAAPNGEIRYLELSIDIDCNAACLSCNDGLSSTWVAQNKKFKIKTEADYPDPQDPVDVVNQLFQRYDFEHLTQLLFFGGEPFRSATTELFLVELCKKFDTSNIELTFVTNASIAPKKTISDLFSKFRKVNMNLSIDGVGKQFEYLRYPLKWDRVVNNISYLRTLDVDQFLVTATINPFNAYYCDEIISWAQEFFGNDRLRSVAFSKCTGVLDLHTIPVRLLKIVQKKYADHPHLSKMFGFNQPWWTNMFGNKDPTNNEQMMKYIAAMDSYRKQSWQQTFPEIVEFFN